MGERNHPLPTVTVRQFSSCRSFVISYSWYCSLFRYTVHPGESTSSPTGFPLREASYTPRAVRYATARVIFFCAVHFLRNTGQISPISSQGVIQRPVHSNFCITISPFAFYITINQQPPASIRNSYFTLFFLHVLYS